MKIATEKGDVIGSSSHHVGTQLDTSSELFHIRLLQPFESLTHAQHDHLPEDAFRLYVLANPNRIRFWVDDKEKLVHANLRLFFARHSNNNSLQIDNSQDASLCFILTFKQELLSLLQVPTESLKMLSNMGADCIELDHDASALFKVICEQLNHENAQQSPDSLLLIAGYLQVLLLQALELVAPAYKPRFASRSLERAYRFTLAVQQDVYQRHDVAYYADQLSVSDKTLTVAVKTHFGLTPLQIIHKRLMTEARCFLAHTDKDVAQVAFKLGFEQPSNFIRFFKKHEEITPANYRKDKVGGKMLTTYPKLHTFFA